MRQLFQQPEYIHVLLNPIPIYGLILASVGLVLALIMRSRPAQIVALVLVFLSAAAAGPVAYFGEKAYDRISEMADNDGREWLETHEHRGEDLMYFFYGLALLSLAALFIPKKWPRTALPLAVATLLLAIVCAGVGSYIADAGGKIRHREFRTAPPPEK